MVNNMNIKVGIPRGLFYYYYGNIWINFFEELDINVIISPKTNKEIVGLGMKYSTDEMCLSMKNYIGHVVYLNDKCDYIIIPRIDNYGDYNQMCTNFLSAYDYLNNILSLNILHYNVNINNNNLEKEGLINIAYKLGISKQRALISYKIACIKNNKIKKARKIVNYNKLESNKLKILLISHSYNTYDEFIGIPIIKLLENMGVDIIFSDQFDSKLSNNKAQHLSKNLYWKYSKEMIGSIELSKNKIDGIIFLTAFPCGLDSLSNELVMRKINIPHLNLVIDDLDSLSGIETRIESFIDILKQKSLTYF